MSEYTRAIVTHFIPKGMIGHNVLALIFTRAEVSAEFNLCPTLVVNCVEGIRSDTDRAILFDTDHVEDICDDFDDLNMFDSPMYYDSLGW